MRIEKIIDQLCSHELSKADALELIKEKIEQSMPKNALEFEVEGTAYTVQERHFILKTVAPYGEHRCKDKFAKGDTITIIPAV